MSVLVADAARTSCAVLEGNKIVAKLAAAVAIFAAAAAAAIVGSLQRLHCKIPTKISRDNHFCLERKKIWGDFYEDLRVDQRATKISYFYLEIFPASRLPTRVVMPFSKELRP